jgi:hypothetical protein
MSRLSRAKAHHKRPATPPSPQSAQLAAEREHLLQARSILVCLSFALTYSPETERRPEYSQADVADAARQILDEVIQHLEVHSDTLQHDPPNRKSC